MGSPDEQTDFDWVRREIARRARRRKLRDSAFSAARPRRWNPFQVKVPGLDVVFTEANAWQFIADQVENGAPIEPITLERPPGAIGYVLRIPDGSGRLDIYIKVELSADGRIFGRSFHYTDL